MQTNDLAILYSVMDHRKKEAYRQLSLLNKLKFWLLLQRINGHFGKTERMFLSSYILIANRIAMEHRRTPSEKLEILSISPKITNIVCEFFPAMFKLDVCQFEDDQKSMIKFRRALLERISYQIDILPGKITITPLTP